MMSTRPSFRSNPIGIRAISIEPVLLKYISSLKYTPREFPITRNTSSDQKNKWGALQFHLSQDYVDFISLDIKCWRTPLEHDSAHAKLPTGLQNMIQVFIRLNIRVIHPLESRNNDIKNHRYNIKDIHPLESTYNDEQNHYLQGRQNHILGFYGLDCKATGFDHRHDHDLGITRHKCVDQ
jgi:hypothetical protein